MGKRRFKLKKTKQRNSSPILIDEVTLRTKEMSLNEIINPIKTDNNLKNVETVKDVEDNLKTELHKHWADAIHPMMMGSSRVIDFSQEEEQDPTPSSNHLSEYIGRRVAIMTKTGFKPAYTGLDVLKIIKSRNELLFQETLIDITHKTMLSIVGKLKNKTEKRAFLFDDFVFITLARLDNNISKESFLHGFKNKKNINVQFSKVSFKKRIGQTLLESEDKSGLDSFTEMFFHSFKKNGDIRENINIPIPEHLLKIVVN